MHLKISSAKWRPFCPGGWVNKPLEMQTTGMPFNVTNSNRLTITPMMAQVLVAMTTFEISLSIFTTGYQRYNIQLAHCVYRWQKSPHQEDWLQQKRLHMNNAHGFQQKNNENVRTYLPALYMHRSIETRKSYTENENNFIMHKNIEDIHVPRNTHTTRVLLWLLTNMI